MNEEFRIFKDKLNINIETQPKISFGCISLKDQFNDYKGEFFVFAYSYIVSKKELDNLENNDDLVLGMDIEMDHFVKMYTTSCLINMNTPSQYYHFVTTRKPLLTLNEYLEILKKDTNFDLLLKEDSNNKLFEQKENDTYVRFSLCVCFPGIVHIQEKIALDMGVDFMEHFNMEELDIEKIQYFYNQSVDYRIKEKTLSQSNTYYFCLNNLGCLLDMPFNSKGKVYKNNRKNEAPYIYETDTALFDYLDECDVSPTLLRGMDVVVEDVSKLVDAINKK